MSASRKSANASRWAQPAAIVVVIVVHGLMLGVLLRSPAANGTAEEARLAVYWLPRPLPAPAPPPSATPSPPIPQPAASPSVPAPRVATPTITSHAAAVDPQAPRTALDLSVPGSLTGSGIDAASLVPRVLGDREVHPAFQPRPKRFRMKAGMTPEQIVHGIFQLIGAWPPGYTVDQCRLTRQQIDYLRNAVDEMDRDLLRDSLIRQDQDC
ncbi:hypothetical protein K4043_18090 [Stenotrophomonas sp. SRS1]|uniref:hypothetical protein n=1 Tax=Stenotrophomonas sp. SRS1 TaxID=2870345 RepID=UPI002237D494|nr:hypothetical protein [Stenotrophomonas sp. SRS1]MCW6029921.1 hypothetical protein [Stenotrophomonas sp. SRS1]